MTTLLYDSCNTQVMPQWMREERYMYCEPSMIGTLTSKGHISLWQKIKHLLAW